jgi:hypothetical protein
MNFIFDIREKKKNVLRLLVTVFILGIITNIVVSCLLPSRIEDFENLCIANSTSDTLVFALIDNANNWNNSDSFFVPPKNVVRFGSSVIYPHKERTITGGVDLRRHGKLVGDTLKVEVYNYSVTNVLSYDEFVEHFNQYRITYKWFTWEQLRDKDWKLYYPVDFK